MEYQRQVRMEQGKSVIELVSGSRTSSLNQVIIVPEQKLDRSILPEESRILLEKTRHIVTFGE